MEYCSDFGTELARAAKFCGECGRARATDQGVNQTVRRTHAPVIQVGGDARDITVTHIPVAAGVDRPVAMDATWRWNSPLTQSALAWIGTALSLAALIPFGRLVTAALDVFRDPSVVGRQSPPQLWPWVLAFLVAVVLSILVWSAFRVVKQRQVRPLDSLGILPAAWGRDGRLGLARLTGTCPRCGGALRLQNIATEFEVDQQGRRRVARRDPFALCAKNPGQHRWPFDVTGTFSTTAP